MTVATCQDEQALRARLRQARERLDGLTGDLRAIDGELDALHGERPGYQLIDQACGALEELEGLGAAALFWGERVGDGERDALLRLARGRADAFQKRLGEVEERRRDVLEEIERTQESSDLIAGDVLEVQRREEERKLEWVVEREVEALPVRASIMPWTRGGDDDRRFRKALAISLLGSLLLGSLFPLVDLPLPERWEAAEVPDRFARLIREERPPPPPEPPRPQPKTRDEERPVETAEAKPTTSAEPAPKSGSGSKGILAFREEFSGLAKTRSSARLGSDARISESDGARSGQPQRSLVTTRAPGSSGGINLGSLSRDVGGAGGKQIQGVEVARATSSIGAGGGTERGIGDRPGPARTDEEIQIVFDRHKAALYRLYNRELRRDPTLQGQMVLRIRIEPDGSVTLCQLHSTDMDAPTLATQVIERVETFDFGAKEVPPVTIVYPIHFLPAA